MRETWLKDVAIPPLPREGLRDWINERRQDAKFLWPPFRAYYRLRSYKYMLYKNREMGLLRFLVDPDRLSLDIGANLGLFCYFLARLSRRVLAFEPNPYPLRILRRVADHNVDVLAVAISDYDGTARFVIPKGRKGWTSNGGRIEKESRVLSHAVEVPCRRVDSLGLEPVGFIKIDVEGHELAVLHGATETIARDRPSIYLETEYCHVGEQVFDVFRVMEELGYRGLFVSRRGLTDLARFDIERHQKNAGQGYVKNFIFLPR